jgi:hypothetical protein
MASLVIDACVASAAGGEDAKHPVSRACRDFLREMLGLPHKIVRTDEIWEEWRKHKSIFARTWLSSMNARKRVHRIQVLQDADLRLFASACGEKDAAAMLKDCHLVEAAKAADRVVVSQEKVARELFSNASDSVGWLQTIAWVNPTKAAENPIEWLQKGAIAEECRCFHGNCV